MQCASTSTYPENLGSGGQLPAELRGRVFRFFVCMYVFLFVRHAIRCQAQKAQTVRISIEPGGNGHKPPGQFQFSFSFSFSFQFYNKRRHILLQRQQAIEPFQLLLLLFIICSKCPPSVEAHARCTVTLIIWHNFVKNADNWIKMCNLAQIGTFNMCVKFGLKISNRLGKNVRKSQGDFFSHIVHIHQCYKDGEMTYITQHADKDFYNNISTIYVIFIFYLSRFHTVLNTV